MSQLSRRVSRPINVARRIGGIINNTLPVSVYSLSLNGTTQYMDLSTHVASLDFNAPASISFWFKINGSHKTNGGYIFSLSTNTSTPFFGIAAGSFTVLLTNEVLTVRSLNIDSGVNTSTGFTDASDTYGNVWHHGVITCSGTAWTIYLNGVSKTLTTSGSNTGIYGNGYAYQRVNIGTGYNSGSISGPFKGNIDDVRVYNRVLSLAEITAIYGIGKPSADGVTSGLVGQWQFEQNTNDSSGNGYNGTLVNSPTYSTDVP